MPSTMSVLALRMKRRSGITFSSGSGKSERNYVDFLIDGKSLSDHSASLGYDLVSVLAREWIPEERERSVRRLLLAEPADFPNNRRSLLVCSECGDLGCGALSISIDITEGEVTWADFGYQNNYDEEIWAKGLGELGPFRFDRSQYENALAGAMTILRGPDES
jgi:hypothetical protein